MYSYKNFKNKSGKKVSKIHKAIVEE